MEEDYLIKLSNSILNLFQSQSFPPGAQESIYTSPQIAEDLLWCLARWSISYLLIDPQNVGNQLSNNLDNLYRSKAGLNTLSHFVSCLGLQLNAWSADVEVLSELANSIEIFSKSKLITGALIDLPPFTQLIQQILSMSDTLPEGVVGKLFAAILKCVSICLDNTQGQIYFEEIIKVIEKKFKSDDNIQKVNSTLETFSGLIASAQPSTARRILELSNQFLPVLVGNIEQLFNQYSETVGLLLKYLVDLARFMADFCPLEHWQEQNILQAMARVIIDILSKSSCLRYTSY